MTLKLIHKAPPQVDSPTPVHQSAVGALFLALHAHVTRGQLGHVWLAPLDVVLDSHDRVVVRPDVFVTLNEGAATVSHKVFGPPDLVIEVLSPQPVADETRERVTQFAEHGVRECWLVHQLTGRVEVLHFKNGRIRLRTTHALSDRITSGVLPDFDRSLASILGYSR